LTGLYYHLSRYGENLWRPALLGIVIVSLSTIFWLIQSHPDLEPRFGSTPHNTTIPSNVTVSNFIGFKEIMNYTHGLNHWKEV
jgi:hypothetical protein